MATTTTSGTAKVTLPTDTQILIVRELASKEDRDAVIQSGMETGMQEAFDHLEQVAKSLA